MQAEILIVSNGPGELASWVHPVVRQLRRMAPLLRVVVALVPCPYASGEEADSVNGWPEPVAVWTPRETMRFLLLGKHPGGYKPAGRGVVLFLGGDQIFGALLATRTGYPLLTYSDRAARWKRLVRRFLVADRNTFLSLRNKRVPAHQLRLVGNLMVDAVRTQYDPIQARRALGLRPDALVLGLLPGSKPFKVLHVTPLFLRVVEHLQQQVPNLQVVLLRSAFTPREQIDEALENPAYRIATGGVGGTLEREGTLDWIVTTAGARVLVAPPDMHYEGMSVADLALTVPGTNTAELAILGVPMVVALPLHRPEEIPLDGLLGRLGDTPMLGPWLKRTLARRFAARPPLVALPNQRAGQMVTPELIGEFTPEVLARVTRELLEDPVRRRDIKLQLHTLMGAAGAAEAVVEELLACLGPAASVPLDSTPSTPEP
jgi:lipid-A-disaccharide synthase